MSLDELINRLRYRFNDYWHSEKRSIKLISRALALTLFAAILSTIAPTLADELSSDPTMLEPVSQSSTAPSTQPISETPTVSLPCHCAALAMCRCAAASEACDMHNKPRSGPDEDEDEDEAEASA